MSNRCIVFVTDNPALVSIINQQTSKHKIVMIYYYLSCSTHNRNSAYEVKNYNCLFKRLFKVKKDGVFLFGTSFLISFKRYLRFCIIQMREVITSYYIVPLKQYNTQSRISLEILKQCS